MLPDNHNTLPNLATETTLAPGHEYVPHKFAQLDDSWVIVIANAKGVEFVGTGQYARDAATDAITQAGGAVVEDAQAK